MKRFVIIVLAVLMLGLAMPKQSEANGVWMPWMPVAIIASILFEAAINDAARAYPVYPSYAPEQAYVYGPPAQVYVTPPPVTQGYYRYGHGYMGSRQGYGRYRGGSVSPYYGWGRSHR